MAVAECLGSAHTDTQKVQSGKDVLKILKFSLYFFVVWGERLNALQIREVHLCHYGIKQPVRTAFRFLPGTAAPYFGCNAVLPAGFC